MGTIIKSTVSFILLLDVYVLYMYICLSNEENKFNFIKSSKVQSQSWSFFELYKNKYFKRQIKNIPNLDETRGDYIVKPAEKVTLDTRKIFYNRVPKCGSTTMLTLLKGLKKYHKNSFQLINDIEPNQKHFLPTLESRLDFVQNVTKIEDPIVYVRHLHFINFTHYNAPMPMYINVIRDPVEHFISNYYFLRHGFEKNANTNDKSKQKWLHKDIIKDEERNVDLKTCISRKMKTCTEVYSDIIPYFCGNDHWCRMRNDRALKQAKFNILNSFIAVGILEQMDDTLTLFEQILPEFFRGVKWLYKKNQEKLLSKSVTSNKGKDDLYVKQYLSDHLKPERDLYFFVKELMYNRLSQLNNNRKEF